MRSPFVRRSTLHGAMAQRDVARRELGRLASIVSAETAHLSLGDERDEVQDRLLKGASQCLAAAGAGPIYEPCADGICNCGGCVV